jgi:hypothetical protein
MSWEQHLVDAEVEIRRSVFEMNRPGFSKSASYYKEKPDEEYIKIHIKEAIKNLTTALAELDNQLIF